MRAIKLGCAQVVEPNLFVCRGFDLDILRQWKPMCALFWTPLDWVLPAEGFEPPTYGLQNRCTTTVLSRQKLSNPTSYRDSNRPSRCFPLTIVTTSRKVPPPFHHAQLRFDIKYTTGNPFTNAMEAGG